MTKTVTVNPKLYLRKQTVTETCIRNRNRNHNPNRNPNPNPKMINFVSKTYLTPTLSLTLTKHLILTLSLDSVQVEPLSEFTERSVKSLFLEAWR